MTVPKLNGFPIRNLSVVEHAGHSRVVGVEDAGCRGFCLDKRPGLHKGNFVDPCKTECGSKSRWK